MSLSKTYLLSEATELRLLAHGFTVSIEADHCCENPAEIDEDADQEDVTAWNAGEVYTVNVTHSGMTSNNTAEDGLRCFNRNGAGLDKAVNEMIDDLICRIDFNPQSIKIVLDTLIIPDESKIVNGVELKNHPSAIVLDIVSKNHGFKPALGSVEVRPVINSGEKIGTCLIFKMLLSDIPSIEDWDAMSNTSIITEVIENAQSIAHFHTHADSSVLVDRNKVAELLADYEKLKTNTAITNSVLTTLFWEAGLISVRFYGNKLLLLDELNTFTSGIRDK